MMRIFFLLVLGFCLLSPFQVQAAALTSDQMATAEKLRDYLNNMKSLKGSFAQISSNGSYADGKVALLRPGKMRLTYNPPSKTEIIVRNGTIIYHDKEFRQVTYYPLNATPLAVLLKEKLSFKEDVDIIDVAQSPGVIEMTLVDHEDAGMGSVTLVFSDAPLQLRKWTVVDAQGITTQVSLLNSVMGAPISDTQFDFVDPQYDKRDN